MKHLTALLLLASTLLLSSAHAQLILQDFSAVLGPKTFFHGTWEAAGNTGGSTSPNASFVQGAGVYDITGTTPTNGSSSKIEFFFGAGTPFNIGSHTLLSISAQALAGNVAASFAVTLLSPGATAFATFTTASFTGGYSTVTGQLTFTGGFDPANIDSMIISGNQPGATDRFNVSFNSITAVPEPATSAALAGAGVLGFALWHRRRRTARASCGGAGSPAL